MPFTQLKTELDERAAQGLLRSRRTLDTPQSPHIVVDGKPYLAFCSNDYLGLANHPQLIATLQQGARQWGVGAGAAHLVNGHFTPHHQLENQLAEFVGKPAALLFSTGYMANIGVVQALVGKGDTVFADKLNHASLNDAMQLSRAQVKRYRHGDMAQLTELLLGTSSGRKLIVTDAVFSMDGDIAPLSELLTLCEQHDAWLVVDDAHGFGVLGAQGRGSLARFKSPLAPLLQSGGHSDDLMVSNPPLQKGGRGDLDSPRIIYMATLGKAAGVSGAFVAAEQVVIDTLINHAHSYVYTTATPPALSVALSESLCLIAQGDDKRAHLKNLIAQLRGGLAELPWTLMPSQTAIQPLLIGDNQQALQLSEGLRERGIWVAAIRPPTVPEGTARLRITLSAAHSAEDVEQLIKALHELAPHPSTQSPRITPVAHRFKRLAETSLHIEKHGSGEPLLLIHGWGMHGGMWGGVVKKLAEEFCVYVVDLPGHGESHATANPALHGLGNGLDSLDFFVSALTEKFPMPLTVCGWSLGGQVALRWAAREPLKIRRLVLIASTPCFVQQDHWPCAMDAETLAGFADALTENYAQTLRRFLALQVRGSENERELLVSLRTALFSRGEPNLSALQAGLDILRDCDLRDSLPTMTQPTLVIAGERDMLTPLQAAQYMAAQLPNARLSIIKGAAHAPFLSHPEQFFEQVLSFMKSKNN